MKKQIKIIPLELGATVVHSDESKYKIIPLELGATVVYSDKSKYKEVTIDKIDEQRQLVSIQINTFDSHWYNLAGEPVSEKTGKVLNLRGWRYFYVGHLYQLTGEIREAIDRQEKLRTINTLYEELHKKDVHTLDLAIVAMQRILNEKSI